MTDDFPGCPDDVELLGVLLIGVCPGSPDDVELLRLTVLTGDRLSEMEGLLARVGGRSPYCDSYEIV